MRRCTLQTDLDARTRPGVSNEGSSELERLKTGSRRLTEDLEIMRRDWHLRPGGSRPRRPARGIIDRIRSSGRCDTCRSAGAYPKGRSADRCTNLSRVGLPAACGAGHDRQRRRGPPDRTVQQRPMDRVMRTLELSGWSVRRRCTPRSQPPTLLGRRASSTTTSPPSVYTENRRPERGHHQHGHELGDGAAANDAVALRQTRASRSSRSNLSGTRT